jgi:rare lipoprotein A
MVKSFLTLIGLFFFALSSFAQTNEGVASFYAKKFNGRKTACGEVFCNDSLTAAHKTLPFGTYVKVLNIKNDSVVIVKINDRLPASSKRSIDLSQAAARKLNFISKGVTRVKITVLSNKQETAELNSP